MAGYSGTPLPQKLGIKPGTIVVAISRLAVEMKTCAPVSGRSACSR